MDANSGIELGLPPGGLSQRDQRSPRNLQPVLVAFASFILIFTGCGLNFAFGVYQALYDVMSKTPNTPFTGSSPAEIDLIGTLSVSLMTIGAPFATAWTKRYPPRLIVGAGGLIFAVANILASFSQRLWQFELTQGLLLGVGTCLAYMPAVTVAPPWFNARRGLAMGFILSGTGIGGVVWAPVLRALNAKIGFRNTLRLTAGVSFILISAAGSVMKWHPSTYTSIQAEGQASSQRGGLFKVPLVDWRVARSRKFLAQALGAMLQAAAYYAPVYFFASYARTLDYSETAGANFIALSNAANAVGKIAIGHLADRFGRLNTLFATTLISAVTALGLWLPSAMQHDEHASRTLFVAFTILYGIFAGAYVSLFPTSLIEIFGVQHFASVNGVLYMFRGVATMIGTPIAGALIRDSASQALPKSYVDTSLLVGVLLTFATMAVLWVRIEAMLGSSWKWRL